MRSTRDEHERKREKNVGRKRWQIGHLETASPVKSMARFTIARVLCATEVATESAEFKSDAPVEDKIIPIELLAVVVDIRAESVRTNEKTYERYWKEVRAMRRTDSQ